MAFKSQSGPILGSAVKISRSVRAYISQMHTLVFHRFLKMVPDNISSVRHKL